MTYQAYRPAQLEDILYLGRVLFFIAFLSMGYALSRPWPARADVQSLNSAGHQNAGWTGLAPWQRRASERAVENYAAAQQKKWRNWQEAMFEREE